MLNELTRPTGSTPAFPVTIPETSAATIARNAEVLHQQVVLIRQDTAQLRRDALSTELDQLAMENQRRDAPALLNSLREEGFAWRDVARVMRVSVPAVQKWRRGDGITSGNHLRIARLAALIGTLRAHLIGDPVSWLEMPVKENVLLSRMDLLVADRFDIVLELASEEFSASSIDPLLDEFDPEWRNKYIDDSFETYVDSEGQVAIRAKG